MDAIFKFLKSLLETFFKVITVLTSSPLPEKAVIVSPVGSSSALTAVALPAPSTNSGLGSSAPSNTDDPADQKSNRGRIKPMLILVALVVFLGVAAAVFIPKFTSGNSGTADNSLPFEIEPTQALPVPEQTQTQPVESTQTTDPCVNVVPTGSFAGDITVPDGMVVKPGATFTKTWRFVNSGACVWPEGFSLKFVSGEAMGATVIKLPRVELGATVDVNVELIAPEAPGRYRGVWSIFDNQGNKVIVTRSDGDFWVDIQVFLAYITSTPSSP